MLMLMLMTAAAVTPLVAAVTQLVAAVTPFVASNGMVPATVFLPDGGSLPKTKKVPIQQMSAGVGGCLRSSADVCNF